MQEVQAVQAVQEVQEAFPSQGRLTAGATSRWNCCSSAPGDVTMKPFSSSGNCRGWGFEWEAWAQRPRRGSSEK